ncbi:MAG TPA: NnrS family protein [Arenimonas sp.]|nr:NnrS family protein [Arenimonas sp.]
MAAVTENVSLPDIRLLAAAPHRFMFFVGASNVLMAMLWWTVWLLDARFQWFTMPQPAIPAGWMHAIIMQYQVLPPFMFGFLLTVFPRWMNLPPLSRWHYVPVGVGLFGGQLLTLIGLFGFPHLLHIGLLQTTAGWIAGLLFLLTLLWKEKQTTWHAISCATALSLGLTGLLLVLAYSYTGNPRLMFAAIKFGSFGLLLPMYFTVCHRMLPFFASVVIPGYKMVRPLFALALFWCLILLHLSLELMHGYAWLWLPDIALAVLASWLLWQWRLQKAEAPALLKVLMVGFAWLPIAMSLYAIQSAWFIGTGEFILARAPAHALFVGFFGSLLVAMVTRVTQGHSGRPLELGRVAAFAFIVIQITAVLRVVAEVLPDALLWQGVAGILWLLAFVPWVFRSSWIYLTPRVDGQAG